MHKTVEWTFIGLVLIWLAAPWVLVALAWRKWARIRSKGNPLEDLIDDHALLIGQILATASCCAFAPLYLGEIFRWHQTSRSMDAVGYGLLVSLFSAFIGVLVLPFGLKRAKWLSFASCLLNACFVLMLVVTESA